MTMAKATKAELLKRELYRLYAKRMVAATKLRHIEDAIDRIVDKQLELEERARAKRKAKK